MGGVRPACAYEKHRDSTNGGTTATTVQGSTSPTGVRVEIASSEFEPANGSGNGSKPVCSYELVEHLYVPVPFVAFVDSQPIFLIGQPPGTRVFWKHCPGSDSRIIVVPPRDIQAAGREIAQQFVAQVPLPPTDIRFNPSSRGVVGVESWFWVEGYDGRPITQRVSAFGIDVDVTMTLERVEWDFGDNRSATGDLGRRYPEQSTVRHVYQRDSGDQPYTVTATMVFRASFCVVGGACEMLPPITRPDSAPHRVVEAEAVRTR